MSRYKIGVLIEKLCFFILFTGYYLGVITVAWAILPPDNRLSINVLSHSDWTYLTWSALFGCALAYWGVANAAFNLKKALPSREAHVIGRHVMDLVCCASIVLLPCFAMSERITIQETVNPPIWLGLVGIFLIATAFHYRRARNVRRIA